MKIEKIKPIPKYIVEKIKKLDKKSNPTPNGHTRFYSYLTTNDKELVKVTVAVRHRYNKWYYKQCAVHGVHSEECFEKDMTFFYLGGYVVGWYYEGITKYPKWYEDEEWLLSQDKYFDPFAPVVNMEYIAKFPEYKYSAYELYTGVDVLQYLRTYEKHPQTEYLVKLGLQQYAQSKQILTKAAIDTKFRKWLATNRNELNSRDYYISSIIHAYQKNEPIREVQGFEHKVKMLNKERALKPIRETIKGDYKRYFAYIEKHQISHRLYLDYLNACIYLGLDMNEDKNRYPHDFKYWHDVRIDEYSTAKALKDEQERKDFYAQFSLVAKKYLPLQKQGDEYVTIIAKSPADLIKEGDVLNHCVGRMNYDQKFVREETLIFFVRLPEDIDEPFVTVEYSIKQKRVLQCYTNGNTKPNDDVMRYILNIWLPYANKIHKKIVV